MGLHLFLSPHLDDAVLSCGGLIHRLARTGERVIVVTAMAGEPPTTLPDSPALQAKRWPGGDARRSEDALAAQAVRAQVYHLALAESVFRQTICGAGDWIALYPTLDSLFDGIDEADDARVTLFETRLPFPEVIMIYAPLCVDEHVDHRLVRDWALVLTGSQDAPPLKFYEEYPQARSKAALQRALAFYRRELPALTLASEVITLDPADLAAKLRAMGCYRSHLHILWHDLAEMEQVTREHLLAVGDGTPAERFWRVVR